MFKHFTLIAILIGVVLRAYGVTTDLWLDEIWSLNNVKGLSSFSEVFVGLRTDNNHWLNSAYLYMLGSTDSWWKYRLPSLIAGVLVLLFCIKILILEQSSRLFQIRLIIFSLSFMLVLYSTEARGYGALSLGTVMSLYFSDRLFKKIDIMNLIFYWFSIAFAVTSHFSFILFYPVLLIHRIYQSVKLKENLTCLLKSDLIPTFTLIAIYFFYIRYLPTGTGNIVPYFEVLINTISISFGLPELSPTNVELSMVILVLVFAWISLLLREIVKQVQERNINWVLYVGAIIVIPSVTVLFIQPKILSPRYFLPTIIVGYLLTADALLRAFNGLAKEKICGIFFLTLFTAANLYQGLLFFEYGRGRPLQALEYVQSLGDDKELLIFSDQPYRHKVMIDFYRGYLEEFPYLKLLSQNDLQTLQPDIIMHHSQDHYFVPTNILKLEDVSYKLAKIFPHASQSGWTWYVYPKDP